MNSDAHLHPTVRPLLALTDEERICRAQEDSWIGHTRAKSILAQMEDIYAHPRIQRMPGLLIVGGTNMGKSTLLRHFAESHPTTDDPAQESRSMPVVRTECPPGPEEKRFYHSVLDALGAPYRHSTPVDVKHRQAKLILGAVGTRVLLLDELQNILTGTANRQRHFLNVIKYVTNDFGLPIIAAGTSEAMNVITCDPQVSNRLRPVFLPRWEEGTEFMRLLASFEQRMPLQKPSDLQETAISSEIYRLSEGILGESAAVVKLAACEAIKTSTEQITLKILRSLGFVPPSKRRQRTDTDTDDGGVVGSPVE